jgi:hypothetical protein
MAPAPALLAGGVLARAGAASAAAATRWSSRRSGTHGNAAQALPPPQQCLPAIASPWWGRAHLPVAALLMLII